MNLFRFNRTPGVVFSLLCTVALSSSGFGAPGAGPGEYRLFAKTNLMAWCIVPFDAKKRGPEERAAMLEKLGITMFAYDYRTEHIPTFDSEMEALKRHHVRLVAWWFPGQMNPEAQGILDVLERHKLMGIQLWVMGSAELTTSEAERKARVKSEADRIRPIANAALKGRHIVGLYNHGGWFGEPENQIAIIELLKTQGVTNVGIVYNLHHGHDHLDRFPDLLKKMQPYLLAFNLNGMTRDGEKLGKKILVLGEGDLDVQLLRRVYNSGWHGPVGILNHTDEDAETRLKENLEGLQKLLPLIQTKAASVSIPGS
jgi:hypothetical protein